MNKEQPCCDACGTPDALCGCKRCVESTKVWHVQATTGHPQWGIVAWKSFPFTNTTLKAHAPPGSSPSSLPTHIRGAAGCQAHDRGKEGAFARTVARGGRTLCPCLLQLPMCHGQLGLSRRKQGGEGGGRVCASKARGGGSRRWVKGKAREVGRWVCASKAQGGP